jgi:uncharacterized membrane protein YfcA
VATVFVIAVAAFLSSIAGFAFSAIAGAMLFHFRHDTVSIVEILLVCSLANQALNVWLLRRHIALRALLPFVAGGVFGVPAGVWLLTHLEVTTFKIALGTLVAMYGTVMLLRRPFTLKRTVPGSDVAIGLAGGVLGGFAAIPGVVVAIWCSMQPWDKTRQRIVLQSYILLMQVVALVAIAVLRPGHGPSGTIPPIAWACLPPSLPATWLGMTMFKRMSDNQFVKAVNVLLIVSGLGLVL